MKVALVCIAKNENNYIEEWVKYHLKLGFDHVFIYENDWVCPLEMDNITKIQNPGKVKQLDSYNQFILNYKGQYDYAAFLDVDEFLVLKKHKNVKEFLGEYGNKNGIGINWNFYGSNGKLTRENDVNSQLKQFILKDKRINHHIKCILNLNSNGKMVLPHNPDIPLKNTNGKWFSGPYNEDMVDDVVIINHYFHRTFEDWKIKSSNGRADSAKYFRTVDEWEKEKGLYNDIEDTTARDFFYDTEVVGLKKKLTIVIPNKLGQTPEITINSLYKQTFTDFDIIIVNDVNDNANIARNEGLKLVQTEYVLFSDNDIKWHPTSIEELFNCLEENPQISYSYGSWFIDGRKNSNREWNRNSLLHNNYISTMSMVRTKHHPSFDPEIKRFQDWDVWLTMLNENRIGKRIDTPIFTTKVREDGITENSIGIDEAYYYIQKKHGIEIPKRNIGNKKPISILITAYKTSNFIEECLDSIERQTYFVKNNEFEILVGIDGCEETLEKLKSIKHKYRNLKIYMMSENRGTYITTNTLIGLSKYENLIRFDSDDIMFDYLVEEVLYNDNNDMVRIPFNNFKSDINDNEISVAHGVVFVKKTVFDNIAGGYQPWVCGADTELHERIKRSVKIHSLKNPLFLRRLHEDSITSSPVTGFDSEIRKEYRKLIKKTYNHDEIMIERVVGEYKEIKDEKNKSKIRWGIKTKGYK